MRVLSSRWLRSLLIAVVMSVFCAGAALADYAYYFPYFSSSASRGEVIALALTNTSAAAAAIKIAVHNQAGEIRTVETWNLDAHGQKAAVIGTALDEIEGSFQVLSDQPLTGLAFLFAHDMQVMYDLPMTQSPAAALDIPQAAQDGEWGMRIFVSNPGDAAVTVNLTYQAADGSTSTSPATVQLKAYGSTVFNVVDLLPDWGLAGFSNGTLRLTAAGGKIVAFAAYDTYSSGGTFYAGITAVDPTQQENNYTPDPRSQYAVVSCSQAQTGVHALIEVEKPRSVQDNLLPTGSDIKMAAQGDYFYRIERRNADNITKFSALAPATPIWQYSTMDDSDVEVSCNPQSLIFVSETKAYIPRYGSTKMWVVNPAATTQAEFKMGTVELSQYSDADGWPEMTRGVVVGSKLFLLLQRLDRDDGWTPQTAYLAVIDTESDAEIDTQNGTASLKGIPLPVKDPWDIVYRDGKIYLNGVGSYDASDWGGAPADYSGGVVSVDPNTYEVKMIVDDGDENDHPYGNISGLAVVSATRGYFISYAGWGDNSLYGFNPSTGVVDAAPLSAFPASIKTNIAALGVDASGMLWVGSNTFAGGGVLTIINPGDDSVDQVQKLNLNPQGIAFGTWE